MRVALVTYGYCPTSSPMAPTAHVCKTWKKQRPRFQSCRAVSKAMADAAREARKQRAAERRAKILATSASRMAIVEGVPEASIVKEAAAAVVEEQEEEVVETAKTTVVPGRSNRFWKWMEFGRVLMLWIASVAIGVISPPIGAAVLVSLHIVLDTAAIVALRRRTTVELGDNSLLFWADMAELSVHLWTFVHEIINHIAVAVFAYNVTHFYTVATAP